MFCENCGNELMDGVKFCPKCGTPVEPVEENSEQETLESAHTQSVNEVDNREALGNKQENYKKKDKKNRTGNILSVAIIGIICAVILIVLIVIGIFVVKPLLDDGSKQLVYMDDGDIYYLKDMSKPDEAILVDDTDYTYLDAWFSDDGKYLYYYSKMKNSTVNRIAVSKIKSNSKHSGKYIEKIGSDMERLSFIDDKKFLYIDDKERLVLNDKGEEDTIAKDVRDFSLSEDKKTVYYLIYEDNEFCYMDLSNLKEVVIDEVNYLCGDGLQNNGKYFFYMKDYNEESETGDLYSVKGKEAPQKIDEDVYSVKRQNAETGKVYYYKRNEETKKYIDYIDDDSSQSDATATEPQVRDFLTETNESTVMKDCLDEEDYKYYSDSENKEDFYYYCLNYYDEELYYIDSDDNTYYCDYDAENENGYKKAKWYIYDSTAASKKWEDYYAVERRQVYREWMKEQEYTYQSYDLYSGSSSKDAKLICEGVDRSSVHISGKYDIAFYGKLNKDIDKVKLTEFVEEDDYSYNFYDYLNEHLGVSDGVCYYYASGKENTLDVDGLVKTLKGGSNNKIAFVTESDDKTLYCTTVSNGVLSEIKKVDELDSSDSFAWVGADLYYYAELDGSDSVLNVYQNGKSKKVADDIPSSICLTKNGTIINREDYDLVLVNGEKRTKIDRNVDMYSYINEKCILYSRKGDLYLYNGSDESIRIARDIGYNYISFAESTGQQEKTYYIGE